MTDGNVGRTMTAMSEVTRELPLLRADGLVIHHSAGADERARTIGSRAARVRRRLHSLLGAAPQFEVFVVGPQDWPAVGEGAPYGMPVAIPGKVVVPVSPAEWLVEHFREVDGLPEALTGHVEMTAFVDSVVAHEVTHLTEVDDERTWASSLGPMWVSELYANVGMWVYFAEDEPADLDRIARLAEASRAAGADRWPVHELDRMPESFEHGPGHYVWFQMLLILLARQIWETAGSSALAAYRAALDGKGLSTVETVAALDRIAPGLAERLERWPAI
jgi:hypothetical protein